MKSSHSTPDAEPEIIVPAAPSVAGSGSAPEVSAATENLTAWDEPVGLEGFRHERVPLDDEDLPSVLVEEGMEEADRETRLAARDEDEEDADLNSEDDPSEGEDDYPTTGITS